MSQSHNETGSSRRFALFHVTHGVNSGGEQMVSRLVAQLCKVLESPPILITQRECPSIDAARAVGAEGQVLPFPTELDIYDHGLLRVAKVPVLLRSLSRYGKALRRVLSERRVGVLWCSNLRGVVTALPATLGHGIPVIWNIWLPPRRSLGMRMLVWISLLSSWRVLLEYFAQKDRVFTELQRRLFGSKFRVIYTGYDAERFESVVACQRAELGVGSHGGLVATAGLLTPRKGQDLLVRAMATVCREEEADLVIMGDSIPSNPGGSQYRDSLRSLAAELGIADRIHLVGWRDDALDVIAACDVFVSASYGEGLPGAVREAMGLGKAIVATDAGGSAEALGDAGFVVTCGDADALAEKIVCLLRCDSLRKSMGEGARTRFRTLFSTDQLVKSYAGLISELYQCKGIRV